MLKHLKQFFGLSKRAVFAFSLVLVLLVAIAILIPHSAQAAEDFAGGFYNAILKLISNIFLGLGKFCISFAIFALKFFIAVAQYNGYLDAPTVMIGWIMVRDVANMFFVVALLMIAFGTILGLENYQWNKTLIKLILSAILINFSNLICGIFIDIAHVFTITFVSAIAGTAGGNLINMFKLEQIYKITTGGADSQGANIDLDILVGSFATFIFSLLAALIIGAYALIMLTRMVALWVLIILSPLAFIFQVIPQTQQYAKQWWDYFGKYVIAAPVMVFFLWLAFATLGTGDIVSTLDLKLNETTLAEITEKNATLAAAGTASAEQSLSLSAVTTWTNMASFLIPLVLLIVGTKMVEQTGVFGGGMLSKAVDFGKKVATIASGYAAGRWMAGKVGEGAKAAGKGVGLGLAKGAGYLVGVEPIKNYFKRQKASFDSWRRDTGVRPNMMDEYAVEQDKKTGELLRYKEGEVDAAGNVHKEGELKYKLDEKGERIKTGRQVAEMDEFGNLTGGEYQVERGMAHKFFHGLVKRDMASKKKLEKTEGFAKVREDLLKSRTGGVPTGWFMGADEKIDALDRMEQGMLVAEKARSSAKTEEYSAMGEEIVRKHKRFKEGKFEEDKPTMSEQISIHKMRAEATKLAVETGGAKSKELYVKGKIDMGGAQQLGARTGADVIAQMQVLQYAKTAAEGIVDAVKDKHLAKEVNNAAGKMFQVTEEWQKDSKRTGKVDFDDLHKRLSIVAEGTEKEKGNPFIASFLAGAEKAQATKEKTQAERKAVDEAEDAVRNIPRGGRMPSTVISSAVEETQREYAPFERQDASKATLKRILTTAKKRASGLGLDLEDRRAALGSWMRVDGEAWNDDVFEAAMKLIEAKDAGKLEDQQEIEIADMAQEILKRGGFEYSKDDKGKWKLAGDYNRDFSAMMQNLAASGGNVDLALNHLQISREQQKKFKETGKMEDYWDIAKRNGVEEILMSGYKDSQDYFQVAAKDFKHNGLEVTGHYENALNQEYDAVRSIYRANTHLEAQNGMITEMSKRTPNKLLSSQAHSWGDINMMTGLVSRINEEMFRGHTANVSEEYEIRSMTPRTLMKLFGYHESETKIRKHTDETTGVTYAKLGGQRMLDEYKGKEDEMNKHLVMDFLVPAIKGKAEAFSYMMMRLFGSKRTDLAQGKLNIELENGVKIEGIDKLMELAKNFGLEAKELVELKEIADLWKKGQVITPKGKDLEPGKKEE